MARKAKTIRKKKLESDTDAAIIESLETTVSHNPASPPKTFLNRSWIKITLAVGVVIILGGLILNRQQGLFLAAKVNGEPILKSELTNILTKRYGEQALDELVSERLVFQAAAKQNLTVTDAEIKAEMDQLEKNLVGTGSAKLDDLLKFQGLTKAELTKQFQVKLLVDKMFNQEISVSAQEITDYLASHSANLTATDEAEKRQQAEKQIKNSKTGEKFFQWFNDLKSKAKIERFL